MCVCVCVYIYVRDPLKVPLSLNHNNNYARARVRFASSGHEGTLTKRRVRRRIPKSVVVTCHPVTCAFPAISRCESGT